MATNEDGHYGKYSGNSRHSRVTNHNFAATRRDDQAHMQYLKEDIDYDDKHGHSDIDMTADEKHISKLAGDSPIPRFNVSANANSQGGYGIGLSGKSKSGQTDYGAQFKRENGNTNVSANATFRF